jgi:hypothetical protein
MAMCGERYAADEGTARQTLAHITPETFIQEAVAAACLYCELVARRHLLAPRWAHRKLGQAILPRGPALVILDMRAQ